MAWVFLVFFFESLKKKKEVETYWLKLDLISVENCLHSMYRLMKIQ